MLNRAQLIEHRDKPNSDPAVLSHERICLIDGAIELLDKIARLESALVSRGGKVDAEAIMAVLPAEAIAVVVVFAINDHIKHPGPYCIDEIVGACKKISVDDLNAALPEATETTDED